MKNSLSFQECMAEMETEYSDIVWIESSGMSPYKLKKEFTNLVNKNRGLPMEIQKALAFSFVCKNAQIAIDRFDIFQDKLNHGNLVKNDFTMKNYQEVYRNEMYNLAKAAEKAQEDGYWEAYQDFGHVCPDWSRILKLGFSGILEEINQKISVCTEEQRDFYTGCKICYEAIIFYIKRLAKAIEQVNSETSRVLFAISQNPPKNLYEAIQTMFIYFTLHEFVSGGRDRSLGCIDEELYFFYKNDLESGNFTEEDVREIIRFFLYKVWNAKVDYDLPMQMSGIIPGTQDTPNPFSNMIIEEYNQLNIYSPKIHIKVSENTPNKFLLGVMLAIRKGNSSFLLVNDKVAVRSLMNIGIKSQHAENYILIGCYEPSAYGCEVPCSGNGVINLLKALEYALEDEFTTFAELYEKLCYHTKVATDAAMEVVSGWERYYPDIYLDPIFSATYESCMDNGKDAYAGGALYNNSSLTFIGIASTIDSLSIIHKYVYEDRKITIEELKQVLKNNWQGNEKLRKEVLNSDYRYGNNCEFADRLTRMYSEYCANLIMNKPNGRGGIFRPGMFSIDKNVYFGLRTGATPDGRCNGDTTSKNLCATAGMEFGGLTTVINSVTSIDATYFPNGTVLDIVVHPSAVKGEEGLLALLGIYKAYFKMGGLAMHANVFDASELKKAQESPEQYKNLQVRVCGWNAYFVNLTKKEQDDFIKQAKG